MFKSSHSTISALSRLFLVPLAPDTEPLPPSSNSMIGFPAALSVDGDQSDFAAAALFAFRSRELLKAMTDRCAALAVRMFEHRGRGWSVNHAEDFTSG